MSWQKLPPEFVGPSPLRQVSAAAAEDADGADANAPFVFGNREWDQSWCTSLGFSISQPKRLRLRTRNPCGVLRSGASARDINDRLASPPRSKALYASPRIAHCRNITRAYIEPRMTQTANRAPPQQAATVAQGACTPGGAAGTGAPKSANIIPLPV